MRVLVLGASGFIGSAVTARLARDGHEVLAASRSRAEPAPANVASLPLDIARASETEWARALDGIAAVVNCAGTLQDAPGESTRDVHESGVTALVRACEAAGVRRIVHLSAIGIDRETPSAFSRTKLAGDRALMTSALDWVILRPSVVVGRSAYGGSALLRGLAALPILPVLPDAGALQLVHLDDLVDTIVFFISPTAPSRCVLEIAGPRAWPFADAVALFRRWLGFPRARHVPVPRWAAALLYGAGDVAGWLGWRTPVNSTAQAEIRRGTAGDPSEWTRITGIVPRDVEAWMKAEPASVQERWFARLYVLKAPIIAIFGLYWLATGIISLTIGWHAGLALLALAGLARRVAGAIVALGAAADIAIGWAILVRPTARLGLYAALALTIVYAIVATIILPELWADPLGPLLKIFPIVLLNLAALAILPDR